ncbi:MAG: hypothetical protein IRY83_16490 [Chloroflexi bacterium]|nr:hypothetical protein [Chloroflexota bacterium]
MDKTAWLEQVESLLPTILRIAKSCDEPFQQDCFRMLLNHALTPTTAHVDDNARGVPLGPVDGQDGVKGGPALQRFVEAHSITVEHLTSLVDPSRDMIIYRIPNKPVAHIQRQLACLLAILTLLKEDRFFIPDERLRQQCRIHNAYDQRNYAANMKNVKVDNRQVFFWDDSAGGWAVTRPGEQYIGEQVLAMLGPKNEG